jgi:hypothetical protein
MLKNDLFGGKNCMHGSWASFNCRCRGSSLFYFTLYLPWCAVIPYVIGLLQIKIFSFVSIWLFLNFCY